MVNYFLKIKSFLLDTLFPISCLFCKKDGFWLCNECQQKISILNFQVCPNCEKVITDQGKICLDCKKQINKKPFHLDALIAATKYNENNIAKLVHAYKYNFIQDLAAPLGEILIEGILKSNLPLPDIIVPVPLHPRRLRWRGFNQSELLANYLSQKLTSGFEIPVIGDLLFRKKYTTPQMKIQSYSNRKVNVQNSFIFNSNFIAKIKNKKILLIDDIATTASTLSECAKILKNNGANKIFAAVIARQEIQKTSK